MMPPVLAVCNMTPVPRPDYRIGVPRGGRWHEMLNTDSALWRIRHGQRRQRQCHTGGSHGEQQSLELLLPPLATLLLRADS